ncbi:MAG: protein translocase SEC61 complex subunit gamma [Thaumarchaeota archaeon]|nr:protein translocase SEC61 complex subunit gamma [Nitrososphaerota archaeon]
MGLKGFLKSTRVTIKLTRKPTKHEFFVALKITLIGVAAIGAITFVVKFLALAIQGI